MSKPPSPTTRPLILSAMIVSAMVMVSGFVVGCAGADSGTDANEPDIQSLASASSTAPCKGCMRIDPLSLNPPAVQEDLPWFHGTAYDCWKHPSPTRGTFPTKGGDLNVPGGTLVECFHGPSTHTRGDGSLASDPNGQPDTFYGFDCPNGVSISDVGTTSWPKTIRYYDAQLKMSELVVYETIRGKLYNNVSGKSVQLLVDNIRIERSSADGSSVAFSGNDFKAVNGHQTLACSNGLVQYNYGDLQPVLLIEQGSHPLDDFYGKGDFSGLLPICNALK